MSDTNVMSCHASKDDLISSLKARVEWQDEMLERAKSLITGTPAETPIEWMYELEKGPSE